MPLICFLFIFDRRNSWRNIEFTSHSHRKTSDPETLIPSDLNFSLSELGPERRSPENAPPFFHARVSTGGVGETGVAGWCVNLFDVFLLLFVSFATHEDALHHLLRSGRLSYFLKLTFGPNFTAKRARWVSLKQICCLKWYSFFLLLDLTRTILGPFIMSCGVNGA